MARAAKRKKVVTTAADMANRRDAAMERTIHFAERTKAMAEVGPGNPDKDPIRLTIDLNDKPMEIIYSFIGNFVNTMYVDLIGPGVGTPRKLSMWQEIATEIHKNNRDREDVHGVFVRVARQLGLTEKRVREQIYYGSSVDDMKYTLYDFLLKFSMDNDIDLKGMLPNR